MLTFNANTTSFITQLNLSRSNNLIKTSIERLSTGLKINRASDDAANMAISKNMECQISGTDMALDNANQAMNLLGTADNALDNMQNNLFKIRNYTIQAMNGTYSDEEKAMMQGEINNLLAETYKQRNTTMFNQIRVFGDNEEIPGESVVEHLTEEEAIALGYTCIHNEAEFAAMAHYDEMDDLYVVDGNYCLMGDIDFSRVADWGNTRLDGELNGNGYSINKFTINSTTNSDLQGLFLSNCGTIKNLNLNNVSIDSSNNEIGGLASYNYGIIDNCSVSGSIKGRNYTGGLVGYNYDGTITYCSSSIIITGSYYTGGLVGYNGKYITSCSSSATVTGNGDFTGGLSGGNAGEINKSYSTSNVIGTGKVGGLTGRNVSNILNSYVLGNIKGNYNVGGITGENEGTISACYLTGTVEGTGSRVGGFVGINGDEGDGDPGYINNSYTTSELDFYGTNDLGVISNCHGRTNQAGVTGHDASWFNNGSNLLFLGEEYDITKNPPDLKDNSRFEPEPPPVIKETKFQIGANGGIENTLTIDTGFSLNQLTANIMTQEAAEKTLHDIDKMLEKISVSRSNIGSSQNRIDSISEFLVTYKNNMEATHSTIMNTDYATETTKLVKNQILQYVALSLLAQANTNPNIALMLLK